MLAAIIAAIIAIIVATVVVVAVLAMRNRSAASKAAGKKQRVQTVQSVGVSSSLPESKAAPAAGAQAPGQPPSGNPADTLKSRFTAMGVFAAAIFGTLTAKLWSMQVLSSQTFSDQSRQNQYTTVLTPAPRGYIYDADGVALVKNRASLTVLAEPDVADDHDTVMRLSAVLGVPSNVVRQRIQDSSSGAQSQRVVASDVRMRDVAFISEHADAFKNVTVQTRTVRDYPYGALASHALGYTGTVGEEELAATGEGRKIEMGDDVGKSGVEQTYDDLLAGDHGQRVVVADADGNVVEVASETQPVKGSDLYLALRGSVQYVADSQLASLIAPEGGAIGSGTGTAGAVVVMDVRDGGIVALANYPTYAPETFVGGIAQDVWDLYNTEASHYPLLNRAIAGTYPAASTYKAFTGLAALEHGFADTERTWVCTGSWDGFKSGDWQDCWQETGHGTIDFHRSVVDSCDVVYYEIAKCFWDASQAGALPEDAMQDEIKKFRFDYTTGIDIAGEAVGRVPTPEWKAEYFKDVPEEAQWRGGDQTNMSIGQGYVLTTPLQLAVAYGGIATGKIMKPHLLKEVRNAQGDVVVSFQPEVVAEPDVDPAHLATVREALHGVGTENATVSALFAQYGIDAAAKTGTAEVAGKDDYAWFVCYAPFDDPKYVVACVVEEGGGGSATAAPLGAAVLNAALQADDTGEGTVARVAGSTGKVVERERSSASSGRTD